jgi:penicillin V acylase-like amidase (Ntn superfamily)
MRVYTNSNYEAHLRARARCIQPGLRFFWSTRMRTRALYQGSDNLVITGRTMDWAEDMRSNAWVFPRGMVRAGAAKSNEPYAPVMKLNMTGGNTHAGNAASKFEAARPFAFLAA